MKRIFACALLLLAFTGCHKHEWSKWHEATWTEQATLEGMPVGNSVNVEGQVRWCLSCGLRQKREY